MIMEANFNPFVRYAGRIFYEQMTSQTRRAPDCRVFFIHRGRGEVQSAGQSHSLLLGTIVYIPADTSYRFVGAQDLQITAVNFDFTHARCDRTVPYPAYTEDSPVPADLIHPQLTEPIFIDDWISAQRVMTQLCRLFIELPPYYRDVASATWKLFLIDLLKNSLSAMENASERVVTYLRRHCREQISNTELARRLNYHPVHLNRLVKEATGMGCRAYIISCRLSEAKQMLISTDASVTEIAERCGFASASHLARLMKKAEGISPLSFRRHITHNIV
jgi:AraC-like DNA-binding protein